jgi:hypothetical protein
VRVDRAALIQGLAAAAARERERREAARQTEIDALIDRLAEMARRFVALARPGDLELARQLAQADWERVDRLRVPANLSQAESVALTMAVDPAAAMRLLSEFWSRYEVCHSEIASGAR